MGMPEINSQKVSRKFRHGSVWMQGLAVGMLMLLGQACSEEKPRVLVFSKTKEFRHESISAGKEAIQKLGEENGFVVDTTENSAYFFEDSLKNYHAVVFLSTSGDVLDGRQENAFRRFIQAGGGFVGIHAAADTEYGWPWYGQLVGAYFKNHPREQTAKVIKLKSEKFERQIPGQWMRFDEWYNYKNLSDRINVLCTLDESSYEGGENGAHHPIVWYHDFDGGRSFYTGMGHTIESFREQEFLDQILMGIRYAIGNRKPDFSTVREPEAAKEFRHEAGAGHYSVAARYSFVLHSLHR